MLAFNDGKAQKMKVRPEVTGVAQRGRLFFQENKYDKVYNKLKPSTNIWGTSVGADWTGKQVTNARAKKNGISNDMQMWRDAGALSPEQIRKQQRNSGPKLNMARGQTAKKNEPEQKKFFGLF